MQQNRNRRSLKSMLADRHMHLNMTILSSVFVFLPSCVAAVVALYGLSNGVMSRLESGVGVQEIMAFAGDFTFKAALLLVVNFVLLSGVAAYLALQVTHHVVGPVQKLEGHLDSLIEGNYAVRSDLRKKDYLANLSRRLNTLSEKLAKK